VFVNNAIGSSITTNGIYISYIGAYKTIDCADTSCIRNNTFTIRTGDSCIGGNDMTTCINTSSTRNKYSINQIYRPTS